MKLENNSRNFLRTATILLGSTITVMAGALISPALPKMRIAFQNVPDAEFLVKLSLTIPSLFMALCAPVIGILLDRWGRKPILIFSVILYGVAGASGFVLDSIYSILVSRALLGIAVAGVLNGFTILIGDYFTGSDLNRFMGLQLAFIGMGSVIFFLIGGILADIGWRFPFLIYLFAFLVLPGVLLFIDEPEIQRTSEPASEPFPFRRLALVYALAFTGMVIFYMIPVLMPFYLQSLENVSSTKIGIAIATCLLFGSFLSLHYHRIKSRFTCQKIFVAYFVIMGTGLLIITTATSYYQAIFGLIISGMSSGLLITNSIVWTVSLVLPSMRGHAIGVLNSCLFMGQFCTPIITQPISLQIGIAGTFGVAAVTGFILSSVLGFMKLKNS